MHILLISYEFPPTWTPQSKRWHCLLEAMMRQSNSIKVTVLCTKLGPQYVPGQQNVGEDPTYSRSINIIRTRSGRIAERLYADQKTPTSTAKPAVKSPLLRTAKTAFKHFSPIDKSIEWFFTQFETAVRSIDLEQIDLVITSGPPHATHAWGYALKKKFGMKWLMDLGDPLTFASDNTAIGPVKLCQRKLESLAFAKADQLVVTTEETRANYSKMLPQLSDRISVIQQGVSTDKYSTLQLRPRLGQLAYIGSFYAGVREPFALIQAVQALNGAASLHIVGPSYEAVRRQVAITPGLDQLITLHGFQSEAYCLEQMSLASRLIFISNRGSTQLPGKLFEYLATKIPILAIVHDDDLEASLSFLKSWPQVTIVKNAATEIAQVLSTPINLSCHVSDEEIGNLSWDHRASNYLRLINKIVHKLKLEAAESLQAEIQFN